MIAAVECRRNRAAFVRAAQRYVPDLDAADVLPGPSGVVLFGSPDGPLPAHQVPEITVTCRSPGCECGIDITQLAIGKS